VYTWNTAVKAFSSELFTRNSLEVYFY